MAGPFQMALGSVPAIAAATGIDEEEEEKRRQESSGLDAPFGMQPGVGDIDQTRLQGYLDPRRQLWGGYLSDMANHFLSGRRAGFQGRGTTAMFGAIKHNQQLEEQERARQMAAGQVANPYKNTPQAYQAYQLAKSDGFDGDFEEWARDVGRAGVSNRPVRTWTNADSGNLMYLSSQGEVVDTGFTGDVPSGMEIEMQGNVPYVKQTLPGGKISMTPLDQFAQAYRTDRLYEETSTEAEAQKWAAANVAFESTAPMMYTKLENQVKYLEELEADILAGKYDTGPITGAAKAVFNENMAYLEADNILASLEALQRVNLAPVTEQEFANMRKLYADVTAAPKANIGRLRALRRDLAKTMAGFERQLEWFYNEGGNSLRGMTGARWRRSAPDNQDQPDPNAEEITIDDLDD